MSKTIRKNPEDCRCGRPLKVTDKRGKIIKKK